MILSNSPWSLSYIYFNRSFVPARFPWHINCLPKCSIFWALWLIFFVFSVHHYWSIKHTESLISKTPDLITSADAVLYVWASTSLACLFLTNHSSPVHTCYSLRVFLSASAAVFACMYILSVNYPPLAARGPVMRQSIATGFSVSFRMFEVRRWGINIPAWCLRRR